MLPPFSTLPVLSSHKICDVMLKICLFVFKADEKISKLSDLPRIFMSRLLIKNSIIFPEILSATHPRLVP